ncbi:MAG: N-acetylmuramoyl-L-alanine amidase [Acidiferrobacterales bacterium]
MRTARFTLLLLLGLIPALGQTASVSVKNLRMWRAPDHTRLVFDLSGLLEHRLFALRNPDRIVIDMKNARLSGALPELDLSGPFLAGVRTGSHGDNGLRVVLDLKRPARPRTFVLKPYSPYGHRLVIDLYDGNTIKQGPPAQPRGAKSKRKDLLIAIDAGHGGEDPGAIGRRYRTREKNVVLAIARQLKKLVAAAPGMRALMIRDGDYYVTLKRRFEKARRYEADLFISIHADALPGKRARHARGASVYALSQRGATSALAKMVADRENASDLIGGVSLSDKDDLLAKVLLDLSQTATIGSSLELGSDVLSELGRIGAVHSRGVQQAGFAVLKAPDMPSILVETAFISNPTEEKKLRSKAYQRKLARGIFSGIKRYVSRNKLKQRHQAVATSGSRVHVVQPGDTLSAIAKTYGVHVDALRFANNLKGSQLRVGRRLVIPQ